MMKARIGHVLLAAIVCALALQGCGGGGGSNNQPPLICDSDPDDPCVQATVPPCSSGQITYPQIDGYTMTNGLAEAEFFPNNYENCLVYPFTTQISTTPFDLAFTPPTGGTTLLYFEFCAQNEQDIQGYPGVAIRAPQSVVVPGRTFYVAANYYGSLGPWVPAAMGPLSISGNLLRWGQGGNAVWELDPGYYFEFAPYGVGP